MRWLLRLLQHSLGQCKLSDVGYADMSWVQLTTFTKDNIRLSDWTLFTFIRATKPHALYAPFTLNTLLFNDKCSHHTTMQLWITWSRHNKCTVLLIHSGISMEWLLHSSFVWFWLIRRYIEDFRDTPLIYLPVERSRLLSRLLHQTYCVKSEQLWGWWNLKSPHIRIKDSSGKMPRMWCLFTCPTWGLWVLYLILVVSTIRNPHLFPIQEEG